MIYKIKRFAIIGDTGVKNMILDSKTGKYIRNPELFKDGEVKAQQMADAIKTRTSEKLADDAAKAANRANRKELGNLFQNEVSEISKSANKKGYAAGMNAGTKAGFDKGAKSVGMMGGLKNTWANAGTIGKVGMGAAAVGGTYLLGKGLGLWGNKKE